MGGVARRRRDLGRLREPALGVNTAATFGAIHFYTQWFERLGAQPWAIIVAGLTVVAIAVALWRYNVGRAAAASPRLAA